jgi:D-glycero-D-manno-heptose 1,7-bisphosphate phosphatase
VNRRAVFLDRDGTIVRDAQYMAKPEQVELLPGAAEAIRRLNEKGLLVVIVTNQSGIARGLFTPADYELVQARLDALLGEAGARVDAVFMCPHHPDFTGPCECRKPGLLLYRQAADQLAIDLWRSFFVGDRLRDVSPARPLGGRGLLVPTADTPAEELARAREEFGVFASLDDAVAHIIRSSR